MPTFPLSSFKRFGSTPATAVGPSISTLSVTDACSFRASPSYSPSVAPSRPDRHIPHYYLTVFPPHCGYFIQLSKKSNRSPLLPHYSFTHFQKRRELSPTRARSVQTTTKSLGACSPLPPGLTLQPGPWLTAPGVSTYDTANIPVDQLSTTVHSFTIIFLI